jgi:four helix bundle protein
MKGNPMAAAGAVNIQERAIEYALRAIKLYQHLQRRREGAGWILGKQYLRSATSIGANLIEAQAGETRKDFVHKCSIAQKEGREAHYWLTLLLRSGLATPRQLSGLLDETNQLIAIVTRIIVNAKARPPR